MAKTQKKKRGKSVLPAVKAAPRKKTAEPLPKEFLDIIAPGAARFNTDHYILGNSYRTVLALRGYPSTTEELALLRHLGEKSGVTLSLYVRKMDLAEQNRIIHNATNKNRMDQANTNDMRVSITAEANLRDVADTVKSDERLRHCAVFIELAAQDQERLRILRNEVLAELVRSKLSADHIFLRQREGFRAVNPAGWNVFGSLYERVLPASSVANLFPLNYSGKIDPHGFYVGKDRYGSNIIVDLDRRAEDKTNGSVLILGNSGEGKSYLLKLLLMNCLEAGKTVIALDPEHELKDLSESLNGSVSLRSRSFLVCLIEPCPVKT